jgi:peptidoglycan hydrolase CwlO-like protein
MGHDPEYDIEALKEGIEKAKKNIKTFEDACDRERETIKEYRHMIDVLEEKLAREK